MIKEPVIPVFDLIRSLSEAMDVAVPALVDHHNQVAYIALSLGAELALPLEQRKELVVAGMLHDIGAFYLKERLQVLQFEADNLRKHAEIGYSLLKGFQPFSSVAEIVRFHHMYWDKGKGSEFKGEPVPLGSHILHLADRVAVLLNKEQEVLGQVESISERIEEQSGKMFMPQLVDALKSLATKEYFWLDTASQSIGSVLRRRVRLEAIELGAEELLSLANLFRRIIDFRSPFTATHSSGVAASAEALARLAGFSERECRMMKVAGYLHDLGKLAVPAEILEKPAKLTGDEFNLIRSHTFYTYRILEPIADLEVINTWGSFHHERLDASGYPFHLKGEDLSLGSRIMAVADVFTAITEDRPYRQGMTSERALQVLKQMVDNSALDSKVVSLLSLHFEEINSFRIVAQAAASKEYQVFERRSNTVR